MRHMPRLLLPILLVVTTACQQVERIADVAPRAIMPGAADGPRLQPGAAPAAKPAAVNLPPPQVSTSFDFVPLELDAAGNRRFLVRMRLGGSPSLVAVEKLTPLFNVDGKGPVEYVTDAFFEANPHRTPRSIQPEDEFILTVPADTFVVRWQEEQEEHLFGAVRLRAYVSDRGDRLRIYLTDRYPILYELESVDKPGTALLRFHPDLAYLLGSGRLDPIGLAQRVYRVEHPDLIQVQTARKLAAEVLPGQAAELSVDRTLTYLDPVREAMAKATIVDRVPDPGRGHLTRAIFIREEIAPFPTARDPNRRTLSGERSYDYLVANRAIMLTFRPIRTRADDRTTAELAAAFGEIGKQYKHLMFELDGWLPELRR